MLFLPCPALAVAGSPDVDGSARSEAFFEASTLLPARSPLVSRHGLCRLGPAGLVTIASLSIYERIPSNDPCASPLGTSSAGLPGADHPAADRVAGAFATDVQRIRQGGEPALGTWNTASCGLDPEPRLSAQGHRDPG